MEEVKPENAPPLEAVTPPPVPSGSPSFEEVVTKIADSMKDTRVGTSSVNHPTNQFPCLIKGKDKVIVMCFGQHASRNIQYIKWAIEAGPSFVKLFNTAQAYHELQKQSGMTKEQVEHGTSEPAEAKASLTAEVPTKVAETVQPAKASEASQVQFPIDE